MMGLGPTGAETALAVENAEAENEQIPAAIRMMKIVERAQQSLDALIWLTKRAAEGDVRAQRALRRAFR